MARQRLVCTSCDAKFGLQAFCPRCGCPTEQASAQERILWEMGQWEGSRERVVPQKPARIVLTPSSPQVVERMARPTPQRPAAGARPAATAGNAVNGSSAMAMQIEELDLRGRSNSPPEERTAPPRRTTPPVPQARTATPPRPEAPEAPSRPARTEPPRPPQPQPPVRREPPPAHRESPARDKATPQRPPLPRPRPGGVPTARPPIPRPRPTARPAATPPDEYDEQHEPIEAAIEEAPQIEAAPVPTETGQGVVRSRAHPEIEMELPTSVGAAQELRDAVAVPPTARTRASRKQRRAERKETARAAHEAARRAKGSAKTRAKAAKKAGEQSAGVEETTSPEAASAETASPTKLSRRERKVERLLDVIGAVEGEEATLTVEGRSRLRSATLIVTQYRVSLLTRGANKRVIAWIPLEEIERIRRVWRGAPTVHIEGSFERLSFQAGTTGRLEEAIALIRREVREARAPGARRHHAEVIQLWCEHTGDVWESDAGRLRLLVRKHPFFTLAWLASLVPIAYFAAHRL